VRRLVAKGGKLHSVETDGGTVQADAVIVCLGAWSARLLEPLGIRTNIYPMRGYSITLPPGDNPNSVSITHLADKMVFSRLGEHIRIAGFADFIGFDTGQDLKRSRQLLDTARRVAPALADYDADSIHEWGGFRPMTPDSCPVVGASRIKGLYLNTGHGMLGWTLACVTAHDVAACLPPAGMQSMQHQMQAN
jgi:D-amino-acid dehydrogenase